MKARRQARRGMRSSRRLQAPHSLHEDQMSERRGSDDGGSLVELESFGSLSRSSTLRSTGTQLRQRHPFGKDDTKTQMLDESVMELSYAPLLPTPAQQFNIQPTKVSRQGSTDSSRDFVVGIETASPSPRQAPLPLPLSNAPSSSLGSVSPRIQLPTPPSESPATSFRSLSPSQPHLQAPSLDNSFSQSTAHSFNTARSALSPSQTEFHSLSPSNPGSPFTDAMSFSSMSGDEGLFSDDMRSRSNESLVRVDPLRDDRSSVADGEHDPSAAFIDVEYGSDEGSDEGSDGSWQDVSERRSTGATSPRL
ncbi:hypothetical protein SCHPADRAFT_908482 [Schizopora paradoxa]|uniref:Uncharacterized protein n=1 Tax=Schizopora paradoxa TaxID=27342 RepID=A0A0H2RB62_9AGAM|nr:hypothetical protein SCHPADRAFT_908482 [Schizopora paradoxa]